MRRASLSSVSSVIHRWEWALIIAGAILVGLILAISPALAAPAQAAAATPTAHSNAMVSIPMADSEIVLLAELSLLALVGFAGRRTARLLAKPGRRTTTSTPRH